MDISPAGPEDTGQLARLLWLSAAPGEQARQHVPAFAADLGVWRSDHESTHIPFVARSPEGEVVGMAWLALLPRVPRPGDLGRLSADVQSVFVDPEHRGHGVGSALVRAVVQHADGLGVRRVTVHSGRRAVPVYERLGFAASRQLLQRPPD